MSVGHIFSALEQIGAQLSIDGDQLVVRSSKFSISSVLREQIRANRELILSVLRDRERARGLAKPALVVQLRPDVVPLSFAQERLWLLEQIGGVGSAYHIPASVRLRGTLDIGALERSFAAVVERHEGLRTRFEVADGSPVQVIDPPGLFELSIEDLSGLAEDGRASAARERVHVLAQQRFDLERGPLFRAHLLRLSENDHVAVVVMHHIVSDGWSVGVLIREVGALYAAFSQGRSSPLPELAVQYADYALWQRGWLRGDILEKQVSYWKERLRGAPAALELPTDRPRPAVQSYRGAHLGFALPAELTGSLNDLARGEGATLFMVLLAAFQVVLSRWSGQSDIVVGSPIAGRTHRELEGLIGFFVNTLALRTDLGGDPPFRELLGRVKETSLGAYAHQDLPFEKLVAEVQPVRDLSRQPVFQVLFALQNVPQERLQLPGLELHRAGGGRPTAKFDLALYVNEVGEGLQAYFEYAADLFDAGTIERLAGHLGVLLEGIVADPDSRIGELPLLSDAERHRLVVAWNATAADYPRDKCLHELFGEQAARRPEAVALVYEDQQLSYGELECRSNQLAHYLRGLGVGPETVVGLCVERSPEMVVGLLGILKAGGAYLPLDPDYPAERLGYMLADAKVSLVVTQAALIDQLPDHDAGVVRLDADWAEIATQPAMSPSNTTLPGNLAYVIYTSGSTGKPKGAMIEHDALGNFLSSMAVAPGISASDIMAAITPLSFDIAGLEIYLPLLAGARVALVPRAVALDGDSLRQHLEGIGASILQATPASWRLLHQAGWRGKELRVLCGGEALPMDLAEVFTSESAEAWNLYGPTETTVWSTASRLVRNIPLSIGRPISNTQTYVLDGDLNACPIGVSGELYVGGAGLARGYLGRAGLTGDRFVPSPFGDGERLYRTGDLARWRADGELEYLGRLDHQVKLRGFRIELGEIEAALRVHCSVRDTIVVACEDIPGDKRLVAYVVSTGEGAEASTLRAHLQQSLPEYMVPSAFVLLDALPLTPNGKIDRHALPAPGGDAVVRGEYVAPRTPAEEVLAGIWAQVLKLDRVGVHDNFFELGGHSLLAMRVMARARDAFAVDLPLRTLFEAPSIGELGLIFTQGQDKSSNKQLVLLKKSNSTNAAPIFCIHPVGGSILCYRDIAHELGANRTIYGIQNLDSDGSVAEATIETISNSYIERILSIQPHDSIHLLGWSLGGIIAYEMVRQMSARGIKIGKVLIVDSYPSPLLTSVGKNIPTADTPQFWHAFLENILGPGHQLKMDHAFWQAPCLDKLCTFLDDNANLFNESVSQEVIERSYPAFRKNYIAWHKYVPNPVNFDLRLIKAAKNDVSNEIYYSYWNKLSYERSEMVVLDADHHSLLRYPVLRQLVTIADDMFGYAQ